MCAAKRGRNGVTIGMEVSFAAVRPCNRPFNATGTFGKLGFAGERAFGDQITTFDGHVQVIENPVGEFQDFALRRRIVACQQFRINRPADFNALEQIGLGPRHAEDGGGFQFGPVAENFGIGAEDDRGAAAVIDRTAILKRTQRGAFGIFLKHQFAITCDFDPEFVGQCVHHRHAHPVQTARGFIRLARKLAARMKRGQDDFKGGFIGEFRMRIGRDTTAVITHHDGVVGSEFQLDPVGMAGDGLVHRVIEDFGNQVMQCGIVRTPDIHTGTAAHRLQAFENFDILGGIGVCGRLV